MHAARAAEFTVIVWDNNENCDTDESKKHKQSGAAVVFAEGRMQMNLLSLDTTITKIVIVMKQKKHSQPGSADVCPEAIIEVDMATTSTQHHSDRTHQGMKSTTKL